VRLPLHPIFDQTVPHLILLHFLLVLSIEGEMLGYEYDGKIDEIHAHVALNLSKDIAQQRLIKEVLLVVFHAFPDVLVGQKIIEVGHQMGVG
jgi:hypothetical protein